ncbi:helix-turn-helix transcriptional regulator [Actinokineospora terrae]|uniref:Helix-turn-helix domain-containing protein n=1 Tax=Actinokineospora terrae TaxID=155974 RepID=A0A1H9KQ23_9PSEU|nr:helix-turn-helix transcriptional regulator [Actinokineospora terrae]SER01281.1 Helix-turn-helix domain-containing protein [Actinokineospora terrae]
MTTRPSAPGGTHVVLPSQRDPGRSRFETDDPDVAHQYLVETLDHDLRIGSLDGGTLRHERACGGRFVVDDLQLPFELSFSAESTGPLVVELWAGHAERTQGSDHAQLVPGDVLVHAGPGQRFAARSSMALLRSVTFDTALLGEVSSGQPRFTGYRPVSPVAAGRWRRMVAYLVDDVLTGEPVSRLVLSNAGRLLAATALNTFPSTTAAEPTGADRHDAYPPTLRRAIAYLEENAARDVSVPEVAAAARVTVRAVQLAFRRHLDTTPLAYLRRIRLDHAHQELRSASPGEETVTAVAARWGFFNAGRFTGYYREAFGVLPSQTLGS